MGWDRISRRIWDIRNEYAAANYFQVKLTVGENTKYLHRNPEIQGGNHFWIYLVTLTKSRIVCLRGGAQTAEDSGGFGI